MPAGAPVKAPEETKRIERLYALAADMAERDPLGALLVRWAAQRIVNGECVKCELSYRRGYTAGVKAGIKEASE